ncbi:unnamed protein product [Durusdinium trenchii]|uniref:protein-tyrosine-phosphatase n=1 Tax=Durusdinium trenchii TaxID=1381693 RepID=A0ABP0HMS5_9DINO
MTPAEVERWLQGLGSLLPREAVSALAEEVRRQGMDGSAFDALVASRATPSLGDAVRPNHMATLRRCWNAKKPSKAAALPKQDDEKLEQRKITPARFDPPPRETVTELGELPEVSVEIPKEAEDVDKEADIGTPLSSALQKQKVARPPQVPKLDLSFVHNKGSRSDSDNLMKHEWKGGRTHGRPASIVSAAGADDPHRAGFAHASAEDQQRIAEFYGYRDEGFIATMNGLCTDMIRPRLYVGNMADAAYWPLLKKLGITHVINCSLEAQKVPPAYESKGVQYLLLPWQDREEEAQSLTRQRFRTLRGATQYMKSVLKGVSRSPALVCAYLMENEGLSLDRALSEVQSKHKGCLTSSHWQTMLHKFNAELLRGS